MDPTQRVIVVEGVGVEPVENDRCVVTVALKITREHAADALQEMSALADKVVTLLHDLGVESRCIATQNVTIQEYYDPQSQRVAGQQATYTLAIGLPDLEEAG
ncbi:MAG: SIMPL domain-containing protein, partial [Acidimicrobiia bacterium]